jgi:methylated-DNA-[protein]-cysteine S-methyltransferase
MDQKLDNMLNPFFSSYYASPIGTLRITCNATHINEVHFMEESEAIAALTTMPPGAPSILSGCISELDEYFKGNLKVFTVPVNQDGTAFQQSVWNELMNIPFGKTISYLTLAKRLGEPKAIRAAASTNGKNKLAIIVPCHRVVGSNQDLVGYAGGLWRKKYLLEQEAKVVYGVQTLF